MLATGNTQYNITSLSPPTQRHFSRGDTPNFLQKIDLMGICNLIFLAFVYLLLISLLYHYLWQARALGKLFEMPGDPQGTRTSYTDTVYYEDPADLGQGGDPGRVEFKDPGRVEFNFKRNPAPQGVKVYNGHRKTSNSSKPAQTNTRTDSVASNVTNTHHKDDPSVDKSLSTPRILSPSSRPLKNHSLPRPNQCLHAFYYAWYGNPETDGRYMHWNHHYMPHWKSSITQQHPQGQHNPPDDIGAGIKVTLHIEPYKGRTPQSVRDDLAVHPHPLLPASRLLQTTAFRRGFQQETTPSHLHLRFLPQ